MKVLFGHPGGSPFSHQAALAYFESDRLGAFCVPWMPTPVQLKCLRRVPGLKGWAERLERRCFPQLLGASRVEGRVGEWSRMTKRIIFRNCVSTEQLAYEAND